MPLTSFNCGNVPDEKTVELAWNTAPFSFSIPMPFGTVISWFHSELVNTLWLNSIMFQLQFCWFHGWRIISASFELGFLNIFSRQNLLRIVSATALQIWREKMSKKPCSIRLLRWLTSANQKTGRTIEKPLKELLWNQQNFLILMKTTKQSNKYLRN